MPDKDKSTRELALEDAAAFAAMDHYIRMMCAVNLDDRQKAKRSEDVRAMAHKILRLLPNYI